MTKQVSGVINIILIIAVVILYWLHFSSSNPKSKITSNTAGKNNVSASTNIAFYNIDSVNSKVSFIKNNMEVLAKKQADEERRLQGMAQSFQKKVATMQENAQKGLFKSQEEVDAAQRKLANEQASLEKTSQSSMAALSKKQEELQSKLKKALDEVLDEINKDNHYDYILSYGEGGAIQKPNEKLNITNSVIKGLNDKLK